MRKYPVFAYVSQKINESNFSNKKQISYLPLLTIYWAPLVVQMVKNLLAMQETTCNTAGLGSVPYSGRSPGGGHGYPLQYSCLENLMDRGARQAMVHRVTNSWTRLKQLSMRCCSVVQSCPTLCDPLECSPPGSSVHGILQARTLEWVAMPSSRRSS